MTARKLAAQARRLNAQMPLVLFTDDSPRDWLAAARRLPPDSLVVIRGRTAKARMALFDLLRRHWGASAEGEQLTSATLDLMRNLLPHSPLDGLPGALVRHLAGDQCADLLGVPRADWTILLVDAATKLTRFLDFAERTTDVTGLARYASFEMMKTLHGLSREGKQVTFRIPDALIRKWDTAR